MTLLITHHVHLYSNEANNHVSLVRLERPPICPLPVYNIMKKCWATDPANRRTFAILEKQLLKLIEEGPEEGKGCRVSTNSYVYLQSVETSGKSDSAS